jgi:TRAP-type C4-dicarboxylate transport system permease large subunit
MLLFMMMKITNVSPGVLMRDVFPFLLVMPGVLALVTVWSDMVLWLPRLMGYAG